MPVRAREGMGVLTRETERSGFVRAVGAGAGQIEARRSGFGLEKKKDPADVELSRSSPRKRIGAGFF